MAKKQMILLSSITYAYKAKDFFTSKGIKSYIERVPANLRSSGCGYGVRVNYDIDTAVKMLETEGIRVKSVIDL